MTRSRDLKPLAILDEDAWDMPDHLTDDDFHREAGPDWRRAATPDFDAENDR